MWRGCNEIQKAKPMRDQVFSVFKDISHGGAKHPSTGFAFRCFTVPLQGLFPVCVSKKTTFGFRPPDVFPEALCPSLGIAMVAGVGHANTTPPRVEGVMGPFNAGVFSHQLSSQMMVDDMWIRTVYPL